MSTAGAKTKLGTYFEQKTGIDLPVGGFDTSQSPFREGDTEYIKMRDGGQKAVRRWSAVDGEYKFTAMGRSFYSRVKRNFVVQIPVTIRGRRKNGTQYNIKSTLPVAKLGVDPVKMSLNLTPAQRTARIKDIVRGQLNLEEPLYEVSQEIWTYDSSAEGQWIVNEETVGVICQERKKRSSPLTGVSALRRTHCRRYRFVKNFVLKRSRLQTTCVASPARSRL